MLVPAQRPAQPPFCRAYHGDRVRSESSGERLPGTTALNSHLRTWVLALSVSPWAACHAPHKLIWKISEPIKIHPTASHQTCSGVNRPTAAQACGRADTQPQHQGLLGAISAPMAQRGAWGWDKGHAHCQMPLVSESDTLKSWLPNLPQVTARPPPVHSDVLEFSEGSGIFS